MGRRSCLIAVIAVASAPMAAACDQFAGVGVLQPDPDTAPDRADEGARRDGGTKSRDGGVDAGPDAGLDAGGSSMDAGRPACEHPETIGCDPVANTNCDLLPLMRCAVDLLATSPTGFCAFIGRIDAGVGCVNTGVTESCLPKQACHGGLCQPLCFCDAECPAGECCSQPIGQTGISVCGGCSAGDNAN